MTDLIRAPFYEDAADGGPDPTAFWLTASDGVRLRACLWRDSNPRGTVLLMPGRTEYIEKYSGAAREFANRGYATLAIDWRGQGLADRLIPDPRLGHVDAFAHYLRDVDAVMAAARHLDIPQPMHLLGHSMGGGIGLFALMEGLPVKSAVFTGPMWGIRLKPLLRPIAWALTTIAPMLGLGRLVSPSTRPENYVLVNPFEGNLLTRDPQMYNLLRDQVVRHPDLAIGGPTLTWLREALRATDLMAHRPSPNVPCLCVVGDNERIIDTDRVRTRMDHWRGGELLNVPEAEHEVMMERPEARQLVFDRAVRLFDRAGQSATA
ncbi:MAG: alpha/beta fold hydrolase [Marinibacterium sp.]